MRPGRNFGSFDSQYTPFKQKKNALDYLYPFLSFSVHNTGRTDRRTDRHFSKKFFFSNFNPNARRFTKLEPHEIFDEGAIVGERFGGIVKKFFYFKGMD